MKPITGIFCSREQAQNTCQKLQAAGLSQTQLSLLTPDASAAALDAAPTMETEQPGMGKALGAVTGGATGLSGGVLGAAVASFFLPGVGSLVVLGAAALGGALGATAGATIGNMLEDSLTTGLPRDELFVYKDALRQGRSVVIVLPHDEEQAKAVRNLFIQTDAESLDAARKQWWLGLQGAEAAVYDAPSETCTQQQQLYRCGFEAALDPQAQGKSYDEAAVFLREQYPTVFLEEPFRRGYERGQAHRQGLDERQQHETVEKIPSKNA